MKKLLAITLAIILLLCSVPVAQAQEIYYSGIFINRPNSVRLTEYEPTEYLAFFVEKSGLYAFYSECYDYSDPFVYCYDNDHNLLGYDDNGGGNENFMYVAYLEKDTKYKFEIGANDLSSKAIFNVTMINLDERTSDINLDVPLTVDPDVYKDTEFFRFTPADSGYYAFSSSLQYYSYIRSALFDSDFNYLDDDDDSGVKTNFCLSHYLEGGKTYYYMSNTDMYKPYEVAVNKCEIIKEVNILTYPDKMTYYEGFINEETIDLSGLTAQFVYTDGSTYDWEYQVDFEHLDAPVGTTVSAEITQDENGKYYGYVAADEGYAKFDINVVDCPVASIEVVSHTKVECYENMTGIQYYNEEKDESWFVYEYRLPKDLVMRINYDDGTYEETRYFDDNNEVSFKYHSDQRNEKWTLGKNPVTITYYDKQCYFYVDVVENPIKNIEVIKAPDALCTFGLNYEDENGLHCKVTPSNLSGIELLINYKDGTSKVLTDEEWNRFEKKLDGYEYKTGVYFIDSPQKVLVTFRYCGHKAFYNVDVVDYGDVNADYKISIMDVTEIQRIVAKISEVRNKYITDYDKDTEITIMDATALQLKIAKK